MTIERPMPELAGTTHSFVTVNGARLHVAEAGAGDPVVLLHGWPQNWWMWRHLIPPLAERYRVICPDFRGYGWSELTRDGYEKDRWAEDVLALLAELGVDRFRMVGHDWGGIVGFRLCLSHPERVARFLALNTAHPYMGASPGNLINLWRLWYGAIMAAPVIGQRVVRERRHIDVIANGLRGAWSEREREIYGDQFAVDGRARASMMTYRTYLLKELPGKIFGGSPGRLETPTLFLHGVKDPVIRPSMLEGYGDRAPNMHLELVPGVGHFIAEEAPDLVRDRALEFLPDG